MSEVLLETKLDASYDSEDVEWQGNRIKTAKNIAVFYTYFDYLDFVYSAKDLQTDVSTSIY